MSSIDCHVCPAGAQPAYSAAALALVARRCAVLAVPLRLRLVQALYDGEKNVTELVAVSGGTQTNVSRHLQILAAEGIVRRRRRGLLVYYEIADPTLRPLCELVCGSLERQLREQAEVFD